MAQAALMTFSISTRHWLPMNELERAILSLRPPDPGPGWSDLAELQAVATSSAAAAAASSRPYRCRIMVVPPCIAATGASRGVVVRPRRQPRPDRLSQAVFDPHSRVVGRPRSEEHTSELQSHVNLVCRLLLEKKKKTTTILRSWRK